VEHQRSVAFIFAVGAALAGYFAYRASIEVVDRMILNVPSMVPPALAAAGGVLFFILALRKESWTSFVDSVITELAEVTWPDREETTKNTTTVIVTTLVFAVVLYVFGQAAMLITGKFLYSAS